MSADTNEKRFEYTKASYWKGSQIEASLFKTIVVLGGFFGLDHLLLRSPLTGLLKMIVNFLTLGFWYFYDILQVFTEFPFIKQYGYTVPGLGPQGIGAGMIYEEPDKPTAPEGTPNPLLFMAYAALIAVPFGFSNFIAGDVWGGAAKFLVSINPFTFLLGLAWTAYSAYTLYFNTESLFTEGTDRIFPFSVFLKANGPAPNLINPNKDSEGSGGFMETAFGFLGKILGPLGVPFFQTVSNTAEKGIELTGPEPAPTPVVPQTGGGLVGGSEQTSQILFLGTAGLILVGAVGLTVARYLRASKKQEKGIDINNDVPPEVNDAPPSGPVAF
jgi:hypothetical protein